MRETVKEINGYKIERIIGTRGYYEVTISQTEKVRKYITFRTIKAAAEFIATL